MNLNLIQICGRLTGKPELRTTTSGLIIGNFNVATNRNWKDKAGNKQQEVEFHSVVSFGKTAETIAKWFDQGDEIYIMGYLKTSKWESQNGEKKSKTEIVAEKFDFGQKKKEGGATAAPKEDYKPEEPVDDSFNPVEDNPFN